jgi:predicted extracellular nuclease
MKTQRALFAIGGAAIGLAMTLAPLASAGASADKTTKGSNPNSTFCKLAKKEVSEETSKQETALETALEAGNWTAAKKDLIASYSQESKLEKSFISALSSAPSKVKSAANAVLKLVPSEEKAVTKSTSVAQFETAEEAAISSKAFTSAGKTISTYETAQCGTLSPPTT